MDKIGKVWKLTPSITSVNSIPKPDIGLRVDISQGNEAIAWERHAIPAVEVILYLVNGSTVFSKLDLYYIYHQIELDGKTKGDNYIRYSTKHTNTSYFRYLIISGELKSCMMKLRERNWAY